MINNCSATKLIITCDTGLVVSLKCVAIFAGTLVSSGAVDALVITASVTQSTLVDIYN